MKKHYFFLALLCITSLTFGQTVTVVHQVDITNYLNGGATLDPSGIRIAGNLSTMGATTGGNPMVDWTPTDANGAMDDSDGDNIWSISVEYPASSIGFELQYKFVNGDWGNDEIVTDTLCGGAGGFGSDRILTIPSSNMTYTYCWDSCSTCSGGNPAMNITNRDAIDYVNVSPNPSEYETNFDISLSQNQYLFIDIYDITGKKIKQVFNGFLSVGTHSINCDLTSLKSGIYIYEINYVNNIKTGKILKK